MVLVAAVQGSSYQFLPGSFFQKYPQGNTYLCVNRASRASGAPEINSGPVLGLF